MLLFHLVLALIEFYLLPNDIFACVACMYYIDRAINNVAPVPGVGGSHVSGSFFLSCTCNMVGVHTTIIIQ